MPGRLPWWHWRKIPVAYLTTLVTISGTTEALAVKQHLVSDAAASWWALATSAAGLILGVAAHRASTPVADPKTADGTPLVPDPSVQRTGPVL